jgi:hypothetical protein
MPLIDTRSSSMSPTCKHAWEAPTAITLSIRSTAAFIGFGADNQAKDLLHMSPRLAPTAASADGVEARPPSLRPAIVDAAQSDQRAWQAPTIVTVAI